MPKLLITASKLLSGKGSAPASPSRNSMAGYCRWASASCVAEKSTPIEANRAQDADLLDDAGQGAVARCTGRLTGPGKHAYRGALLGSKQRVQCRGLGRCRG